MYTLLLKKNEEKRILRGEPWVFANEVLKIEGEGKQGDVCRVCAADGRERGVRLRQRYRQLATLPELHSRAVGGGMVIPIRRIAHDVLPRRKPCDLSAGDGRIGAFVCPAVLHPDGQAGEHAVVPSGNEL